ncbi:MAG: helix-turn-helix domain-containing protein [Anaerolineae bacterium]|nr:helix-turn-helix domain-containing protein [Anaerolineae bacterium]MCB9105589.1 helix-turn-helix domain-containing protein [Anaerolineales bacterium]
MEQAKYKTLGELLKKHRNSLGLKQKDLEQEVDGVKLSTTFLSQVERGKKRPRPEALEAIANTLQLSRSQRIELYLAADYGVPTSISSDFSKNMMNMLLEVIEGMPEAQEISDNSDTAQNIFIRQVRILANIWGAYGEARTANYRGELLEAFQKVSQASDIQLQLDNATRGYFLDAQGEIAYRNGRTYEAEAHYNNAADLADKSGDEFLQGLTMLHQGDIARMRGFWDIALDYYHSAARIFERLNHIPNQNMAARNAAHIYLMRGEWTRVLRPEASLILDKDNRGQSKFVLMKNVQLLGWAYSLSGDASKALDCRQQALKEATDGGSRMGIILGHVFLGDENRRRGAYELAKEHYSTAYQLSQKTTAEHDKGYILMGLAKTYHAKGIEFWDRAAALFEESEKANLDVSNVPRYGMSLIYHGELLVDQYRREKNKEFANKANDHFKRALEIFTLTKSPYYQMKTLINLMSLAQIDNKTLEFETYTQVFREVEKKALSPHLQLSARFWILLAKEKLSATDIDSAIEDYLNALEQAFQFNIYMVDEVQGELKDSIQKLKSIIGQEEILKIYSKLLDGITLRQQANLFSNLRQDCQDKLDLLKQKWERKLKNN